MTTEVNDPIVEKWDGDFLNRVEVARFLTAYLNSIYAEANPDLSAGHFVLNLNATWGQGKTFLLKKWSENLNAERYPVVTFDAWKNDFSKDPLVGFISELDSSLAPWLTHVTPIKVAVDRVVGIGKKLIGVAASAVGGAVAGEIVKQVLDSDDLGKVVSERINKLADKALKEHKQTATLIEEFKNSLRDLIETIQKQQKEEPDPNSRINLPLYIFVDELDRCRPTYAIELLENIKHLFGVKGVIFVVATNKEQLCHSINAVYGNSFDSAMYLGRFFDQEYSLPEPDNKRYANYLFDRYKIKNEDRLFSPIEKSKPTSSTHLTEIFSIFSDAFGLPLREQEQTVHRIKAILAVYQHDPIYFDFLVFLLMLKRKSEGLFEKLFVLNNIGDRSQYESELSKIFNGRISLKIPIVNYYGETLSYDDESLFELIYQYITLQNIPVRELNRQGVQQGNVMTMLAQREASNFKSTFLSISEYPKLVKQVGQLS